MELAVERLFGQSETTKNESPPPSISQSIHRIQHAIDRLEKRADFLQTRIDAAHKTAKIHATKKDKKRALLDLKRRRMLMVQLQRVQNTRLSLESQVFSLENAVTNRMTFDVMRDTTSTLQHMHRTLGGVEDVDDTMLDVQSAMEEANDIGRVLAEPLDTGFGIEEDYGDDEKALEAELDALVADYREEQEETMITELLALPDIQEEERPLPPTEKALNPTEPMLFNDFQSMLGI